MALRAGDGAVLTDSPNMALILANYYASVYRTDEGKVHPSLPAPSTIMNAPRFTSAAVHKELSTLDTAKGSGPDDLRPCMLQILADFLEETITAQYNKSLQSGEIPQDWRKAIICPILKKGDPEDAANYRPVSLTSVFEKWLKKAPLLFLAETRSLSPTQHGFLPRRSCLSNRILQEERVTCLLDEGHKMDFVYLDFAKAFDSVNHRFILAKLKSGGIDGAVLNCIKSYLSNRSYQVQIDGVSSEVASPKVHFLTHFFFC